MAGPIEETGKVATGVIDALKSQPMTLAIMIFNVAIFALVYFSAQNLRASQNEIVHKLIEQNAKAQELLSKCIVPHTNYLRNDDPEHPAKPDQPTPPPDK